MKEIKRLGGDTPALRGPDHNVTPPVSHQAPTEPFVSNMDRHRQRFMGGKLALRELTYQVQLDQNPDRLVLPRLRLEVRDDLPVWVPPRRRRRKRRQVLPNLSRHKYLVTKKLARWMKRIVELLAGERRHMRVLMVQDAEAAPLEWEGKCESCGATFSVKGIWSVPDRLPELGGRAFLRDCDAPDEAILTRVMMPRPGLKTTRKWLRVRRIAPPR